MKTTTTTLAISNPINDSLLRYPLMLVPFVLMCIAVLPSAVAVSPAPDGGYPGFNTAEGDGALQSLTSGVSNTALGFDALFSNTTGNNNSATGIGALGSNTIGSDNTANGFGALLRNTSGPNNTAVGFEALLANTSGFENAAIGSRALFANTSGFHNTADGFEALSANTTGNHNTAAGDVALENNTTGSLNTAAGAHSFALNTTGSSNIALGFQAGDRLTRGNNNIDIGNTGVAAESETMRIGTQGTQTRTFIAGIRGVTTGNANAVPVVIDSLGQLGTFSSAERFKKDIKPMGQSSEAILTLKPVTFHYKTDNSGTPQFGLIAEEVAKINPDLVVRDEKGEIYTVRYDAVNAMLLNEFLKEHRTVRQLEQDVAMLAATVKQQATQIQKLNAQGVSRPATEVVLGNQ
jgi:Chaperone of endosialidase